MMSFGEELEDLIQTLEIAGTADRDWKEYINSKTKDQEVMYSFEEVRNIEEQVLLRQIPEWRIEQITFVLSGASAAGVEVAIPRPRVDNLVLQGEIVSLREEQRRLREEHAGLRQYVQHLERKLEVLLSVGGEMDTVPVDQHTRWIEANLEILRSYPDEWIALHSIRGILFHDADGEKFANMLDELSSVERDEVLAFHSSMYI